MYKICFYAPDSHVDIVKNAMFAKGAGKIGNYSCCAWQTLGEGQFMPLTGSDAYIGEIGHVEKVAEYKVEMVCDDQYIQEVIAALKTAHPYEEPAYHVWSMERF
jgi:structural hemagglutinin/hemolysin toxin protein RtxA